MEVEDHEPSIEVEENELLLGNQKDFVQVGQGMHEVIKAPIQRELLQNFELSSVEHHQPSPIQENQVYFPQRQHCSDFPIELDLLNDMREPHFEEGVLKGKSHVVVITSREPNFLAESGREKLDFEVGHRQHFVGVPRWGEEELLLGDVVEKRLSALEKGAEGTVGVQRQSVVSHILIFICRVEPKLKLVNFC